MHLPVEFSICGGVTDNSVVKSLNSVGSSLVVCDGDVNFINESEEVFFIFGGDLIVSGICLVEPCNNLSFIEIKGKSVILNVDPRRRVSDIIHVNHVAWGLHES